MHRELVERAMAGDHDAFSELARVSIARLYAAARLILRDAIRAEDATQEALVAAWRDLSALRDPDRFEAWLHRLLVRACYREARRDHRGLARVRDIDTLDATDDAVLGADPMIRIVSRDEMERAFRQLTPEHRAVLVLRFYVGLHVSEIAETLEIPLGTAASRLHYALRDLRAACETADRPIAAGRILA
jgi:RNA polymerase sigma-70 factor (ECF subfamily)